MDTEKIVLDYINSKSKIPGKSKNEQLNYDYLSSGSIDSMQMVEMIEFLESKFKNPMFMKIFFNLISTPIPRPEIKSYTLSSSHKSL